MLSCPNKFTFFLRFCPFWDLKVIAWNTLARNAFFFCIKNPLSAILLAGKLCYSFFTPLVEPGMGELQEAGDTFIAFLSNWCTAESEGEYKANVEHIYKQLPSLCWINSYWKQSVFCCRSKIRFIDVYIFFCEYLR